VVLDLAVTMVNLSLVLQQKMDYSITVFGQFWKIKLETFGWVREKQVSTFTMEKHLLLIRNINTSLQRTNKYQWGTRLQQKKACLQQREAHLRQQQHHPHISKHN
jgi:hypothetical protein